LAVAGTAVYVLVKIMVVLLWIGAAIFIVACLYGLWLAYLWYRNHSTLAAKVTSIGNAVASIAPTAVEGTG
jgi:hypothetical protein